MASVTADYALLERSRTVETVVRGVPTTDGAGVNLSRVLRQQHQARLDPFLMLDEFRSDDANDYIAGFPDHPHRGFETVTYMLAGNMRHHDSTGRTGNLTAGSVQWMTAGRGIIHSEMPQQVAGLMHGFQLWVNLPARDKLCPPRYQEFAPDEIPAYELDGGGRIKVIAGSSQGVEGAVQAIATTPLYLDIRLPPARSVSHAIPSSHNAFAYVYEGNAHIGPADRASPVARGGMAILSSGADSQGVGITTCDTGVGLLLIAGMPLHEPIVQWGPFVMTTREEIEEAVRAYHDGTLVSASH